VGLLADIRRRLVRAKRAMRRWSAERVAAERVALNALGALPKDQWPADINERVVDYLAQRYLPAADQRTEADWRRARQAMLARVAAVERGDPLPPRPPTKRSPIPPDPIFEAWLLELKKRR
jgi:hypothetical protein